MYLDENPLLVNYNTLPSECFKHIVKQLYYSFKNKRNNVASKFKINFKNRQNIKTSIPQNTQNRDTHSLTKKHSITYWLFNLIYF